MIRPQLSSAFNAEIKNPYSLSINCYINIMTLNIGSAKGSSITNPVLLCSYLRKHDIQIAAVLTETKTSEEDNNISKNEKIQIII